MSGITAFKFEMRESASAAASSFALPSSAARLDLALARPAPLAELKASTRARRPEYQRLPHVFAVAIPALMQRWGAVRSGSR